MSFLNKAQFVGLSTDEKPTALPGYTDDLKYSLFLELDTLDIYYFNGEEWAKCGEQKQAVYLLNETSIQGTYVQDAAYYFSIGSYLDADAETALNSANNPDLYLTIPELNIENMRFIGSVEDGWVAAGKGSIIINDDDGKYIGAISEDLGATLDATITLSFYEA